MARVLESGYLLRRVPADVRHISKVHADGRVEFTTAVFQWDHFKVDGDDGVSFYVREMLTEQHPLVENMASLVAAAGALGDGNYLVLGVTVSEIKEVGYEARLVPTDELEIGHAHAVVTFPEETGVMRQEHFQ